MLTDQQIWIAPGDQRQEKYSVRFIAELIGTTRKEDHRDGASLPDHLKTMIQLAIDEQAAADKKIIHLVTGREVNDLVQFSQAHFIRIDQHGQFLLAGLPGLKELGVK